jgi:hypothetical protein
MTAGKDRKRSFFMKLIKKFLGIATIIAVIGLSFIACEDLSDNDKNTNDETDYELKLPPDLGEDEYIEYPLDKGYNVWAGQVYQKGWAIGGIKFEGTDWASPESPQSERIAEDVGYDIEMFQKATKLAILMPNASYPRSGVDIVWGGEDASGDPENAGGVWSQRPIASGDGEIDTDIAEKYGNVLIIDLTKALPNYNIYKSKTTVKVKIILQVNAPSYGNVEGLVRKASLLIPKTPPEDTFTSVDDLKTYLSDKGSGVYNIKLNVNDLSGDYETPGSLGEALIDIFNSADSEIYVNLDLSESAFADNSIENWAFFDCTSLKSIIIPSSVTSIGAFAFENCTSLTDITILNKVTSIGQYAFANCTSLTSITIPSSVTSIGKGVFHSCTSLTSVTIRSGINNIADNVFEDCTSLINVTIPNSVTSISFEAFSGCTSLISVTIPDSVNSIGARVFYGCTRLTSVTIPDSVNSIGAKAFSDCTNLTSVTFQGMITSEKLGSLMGVNDESAVFTLPFDGDLSEKYLEGGIGTYERIGDEWTKQD